MVTFKNADHTTVLKKNNSIDLPKAVSASKPASVSEDLQSQRDLFIVEGNNLYANINPSSVKTSGFILDRELNQFQIEHKQNDLKNNETNSNESRIESNKSNNME